MQWYEQNVWGKVSRTKEASGHREGQRISRKTAREIKYKSLIAARQSAEGISNVVRRAVYIASSFVERVVRVRAVFW